MGTEKTYLNIKNVSELKDVLKEVPNLVWFVVGDGPKKDFLLKEIQKNSLQSS